MAEEELQWFHVIGTSPTTGTDVVIPWQPAGIKTRKVAFLPGTVTVTLGSEKANDSASGDS